MRFATWNVNSLKARLPRVEEFLGYADVDVLCLQETKMSDKTLPSLPTSVLNVMQTGRAANRAVVTSPETATEQLSLPFDYVITGSYSLKIHVN